MNEFNSVPHLFFSMVRDKGRGTALRKKEFGLWRDISWEEYGKNVRQVARGLISLGFEPGQCATIAGDNSPEWVYAYLGIMAAGGVAVGIYATNAADQCRYIAANSRATFYFAENEEQLDKALTFRDETPELKKIIVWDMKGLHHFCDPMVLSFEELLLRGGQAEEQGRDDLTRRIEALRPSDLALLIYTSGTTGPPKGAMISHDNLLYMAEAMAEFNPVGPRDEFLSFLPLCHIFEQLFTVLLSLRYGPVVNFIESTDTVMDNMREVSPTVGYAVPRIWEKYYSQIMIRMTDAPKIKRLAFHLALRHGLARIRRKLTDNPESWTSRMASRLSEWLVFRPLRRRLGFERIRVAFSGAAPISPDVLIFYQAIGVPLREGYGQTEGTGVTTVASGDRIKPGTVGRPLPGCQVRIAPDGEIMVKSPGVFQGYFRNPEATAETLKDGWLYSGDVGRFDEEGFLLITDRKKDLIITAGGKNIAPQFIENQLKFSPYIHDAVVVGDRRKYLTALIVLDEDSVALFAREKRIPFGTYASLTARPEVVELIQAELDQVNSKLSRVEQIKKFTILPKKLYAEDGEVTPTMKVKRQYIGEAFKDLIEAMY